MGFWNNFWKAYTQPTEIYVEDVKLEDKINVEEWNKKGFFGKLYTVIVNTPDSPEYHNFVYNKLRFGGNGIDYKINKVPTEIYNKYYKNK